MNDPIADMLSRIKNALNAGQESVDIPHSGIKAEILKIFFEEGYIGKLDLMEKMNKKFIRLALKYRANKKGVIRGLKRVSKSGRRVYADVSKLPRVQSGFGTAVISTSRGVLTDQQARGEKVGGEVLCYIW